MSKHCVNNWSYIYIACPDNPVYLQNQQQSVNENENESENRQRVSVDLQQDDHCEFFVLPKHVDKLSETGIYVHTSICAMQVFRMSEIRSNALVTHCIQFGMGFHKRGVYIKGDRTTFKVGTQRFFEKNLDFDVFELVKLENNSYIMKPVFSGCESVPQMCLETVKAKAVKYPFELQTYDSVSPIFININFTPVFHDFHRTKQVLADVTIILFKVLLYCF